jgi:hypothetical protein
VKEKREMGLHGDTEVVFSKRRKKKGVVSGAVWDLHLFEAQRHHAVVESAPDELGRHEEGRGTRRAVIVPEYAPDAVIVPEYAPVCADVYITPMV